MSAWKLVVNFLLPPPLVLTILLILPCPAVVKKGLLYFTRSFLFYSIAGKIRLVHLALVMTGTAFAATSFHTYQLLQIILPEGLSPNAKTAALARRWREERNFWIACLTFLLWGLLYRFYTLMLEHAQLRERVRYLEAVVAKIPAGDLRKAEPSAPPAPPSVMAAAAEAKKAK